MNLNQFYNDKARAEKIAAENSAVTQRVLAKIAAAAQLDEKAKLSKQAVDSGAINAAQRENDKFYVIDEGAQAIIANNAVKPGTVHRVGINGEGIQHGDPVGTEPQGVIEKDAAVKTAAYVSLIEHVKLAANRERNLEKVACFNCGGAACGVCDGLGTMPKYAADLGAKFVDEMSTFIAAQTLSKQAAQVLEATGNDSVNFAQAKQEIQAVQGIVDANFAPMIVGKPPVGAPDWGGEHIMQNRNVLLLSPNFHSY